MTYKEISKALQNAQKNDEVVEIFRGEMDEVSILANVISFSQDLICVESINDFTSNGYRILRLKDITDISLSDKNDSLRFMNYICKKEDVFSLSNPEIDIKSWASVFAFLASEKLPVTVECALDDAFDYYVGWITSLNGNIATMKCYDGSGVMFEEDMKINLSFVSQIMVKEKYTTLTAKYVVK